MHLIKNTYQDIKMEELSEKIKKIFDQSIYQENQIKKKLELKNKNLFNRLLTSLSFLTILSFCLFWQVIRYHPSLNF